MRLWIEGDDARNELATLHECFRRDPVLRTLVNYHGGHPVEGTLGISDGFLVAAVSGGGALTALAASLKGFFERPRRPGAEVYVAIQHGDAKREIDIKNAERLSELTLILERFTDGGE